MALSHLPVILFRAMFRAFSFALSWMSKNDDFGFYITQIHHHGAPLVALDDGPIGVDHDGIGVSEFVQAVPDLDVLRVLRGQFLARIVFSRV